MLLVALQLLTRLPVGDPWQDRRDTGACVGWFGVVGAIVGGVAASALWVSELVLPPMAAATIAVGATTALTGGLHEDGLADSADGLFGGARPGRRLEIMRDPRIGAYGVLALVLVTLLRVVLLASLDPVAAAGALVATSAISRGALGVTLVGAVPAAQDGRGADLLEHLRPLPAAIGLVAAVLIAGAAVRVAVVGVVVAALLVAAGARGLATRRLGGVNGDVMGAMVSTAEVAGLAAVVIAAGYGL